MSIGIAAKNTMFGQNILGYIQNGLIAMWDGEYNVGLDAGHDPYATIWRDIGGGHCYDLNVDLTQAIWKNNYLEVTGTTCTRDSELTNIVTLEVLFRDNKSSDYTSNNGSFFVIGENKGPCCLWYEHVPGGSIKNSTAISANDGSSKHILASRTYIYNPKRYYVNGTSKSVYLPPKSLSDATGCKAVAKESHHIEIYHLRAYSRALTTDEISYNYSIDKVRFNLS